MASSLTATTILSGTSRRDVAVPMGTTVAELLAMLHMDADTRTSSLTCADGTPVGLDMVFGRDLISGTVLTLSGSEDNRSLADEVERRASSPWLRPVLVLSLFLGWVVSIQVASLIGPVLGLWFVAPPIRLGGALVCAVSIGVALRWRRLRHSATGILATTTLLGICGTAVLPATLAYLPQVAFVTMAWTALLVSLVLWLIDQTSLGATMAAIWAVTCTASTVVVMSDTRASTAAAITLSAATLAVATIPTFAFRIPENQLLDLPLVTTSAPAVRSPEAPAPSRITASRVRRSLRDADARNTLLLVTCCGAAAISAFPAAELMATDHWRGRVALIMMMSSFLALALTPRTRRDRISRVLPRVSALVVLIAVLTAPAVMHEVGASVIALLAVLAGAAFSIAAAFLAQARESALLGRFADLAQSLSLFLILPASLFAAGLFDFMRILGS